MRAATEGSLPPVMPQGNLVEVFGREVRQGSPGELMVESTPSRQRRRPCKSNKEESDEAADAAALTYLLTYFGRGRGCWRWKALYAVSMSCQGAAFSGPGPMLRAPLEVYCQIVNSQGWSTVSTHPPALLVPYYNLIT